MFLFEKLPYFYELNGNTKETTKDEHFVGTFLPKKV